MDYRHLLKRYMQYVIDVDAISYIDWPSYNPQIKLSKEELDELHKIEKEIMDADIPAREETKE